jgi:hypothetical protein
MNAVCTPTCRTYTDSNSSAVVFKFGVRLDQTRRLTAVGNTILCQRKNVQ